ncbi:MAG TPA: cation transporter, partial [Candidatus Fermentibacter sp.]|nr:cation transporter [Candidatus Fermentibacter sp.]
SFRLRVVGMSCGSCERRVREALLSVRGVKAVSVSRQDGTAVVDAAAGFDRRLAVAAVTGLGYEASAD